MSPMHSMSSTFCQAPINMIFSITNSENGWTDGKIGHKWLSEIFDPLTKDKAQGRARVLILDGHSSHFTLDFLNYARDNNIIVLGYPPHCTHALQGLDVVCFGKMKQIWKAVISTHEEEGRRAVEKSEFTGLFGTAYNKAFDPETVKAAFRVTGVVPFNRNAISEKQMKPSTTTSIRGEFPLPQPSPVRAAMILLDKHLEARAIELMPVASTSQTVVAAEEEGSPMRRRMRDEEIDPALLYTPTKRLRLFETALSSTSSGSFLMSSVTYNSSIQIIEPVIASVPASVPFPNWNLTKSPERKNWVSREMIEIENELLRESLRSAQSQVHIRDLMMEETNAQLLYQNLHLRRQNKALHNKEKKLFSESI
jgi:hypothetical protein